jgi:hypothetical protein
MSSSRRSSPVLPPATINTGGDDNSELEDQLDLSTTDVDEEDMEEVIDDYPRQREDPSKGKKKLSKDTRMMALSAGKSSAITIVSWVPRLSYEEVKIDCLKHGPRPSPKTLQPPGSFVSSSGATPTRGHFPSSPGSRAERNLSDTDDDLADNQGVVGKELALLRHAEVVIYKRTIFGNPFPRVVTLNKWLVEIWREAEGVLGSCEQTEAARGKVQVQNLLWGRLANNFALVETISFANSFALRLGYQKGVSPIVQFGPAEDSRGTCSARAVFAGERPLSLPRREL